MKKLARMLRSERGELLLDSLVGIVIIAVVMTVSVGVLMLAAGTSTGTVHTANRTVLVHNTVSDEKPRIGSHTAAGTVLTVRDGTEDVPVTVWREQKSPTLTILHAATPRHKAPATACTDPADLMPGQCLRASVAVPSTRSGVAVTEVPVSTGTPGTVFSFTVPAGATELRYVIKAATATEASTVVLATATPGVTHTITVPAGGTGYYYGRILVDPGTTITATTTGTVALDPAATTIYEAP